MIQEALFSMPAMQPPKPPTPVAVAEPLGPCVKCNEPSQLKSPSGTLYCSKHGYCARRTCLKSVEKFVMHPRLGIWVCSCVLKFEKEMQRAHDDIKIS